MTSVKPKTISFEHRRIIDKMPNIYGIADELVEYSKEYKNVFSSLLGNTVVAEDMDAAMSLSKQTKYSFKIVTLDGDVINASGTMSGGSKKVQAVSIIGREREIQSLADELENNSKRKKEKEEELIEAKRCKEFVASKLEEVENKQIELGEELNKLTESLTKFKALAEETIISETRQKNLREEINKNILEIDEKIAIFTSYEEDINSGEIQARNVYSPEMLIKKNRLNHLNEELTKLLVSRAKVEGEIVSIEGELLRLGDSYKENTKEKRTIFNLGSKVTAGKLDYRPFVETLNYNLRTIKLLRDDKYLYVGFQFTTLLSSFSYQHTYYI